VASGSTPRRGVFITFEGGEGSGKSTQANLLTERLRQAGIDALLLREPGGTLLGEELRRLLLHSAEVLSVSAELLLFLAARAELVMKVIRPAIENGRAVVCDRFSDSTFAYQGFGRGLDFETIRRLNDFATGGLRPDLTVLLDVPVDLGRQRKNQDNDAFIREAPEFHRRVLLGFRKLAADDPGRWLVVDGGQPVHQIGEIVDARVRRLLEVAA